MDNPLHNGNMDDFFGDNLHNYQTEPDEMVWDNIKANLDQPNQPKKHFKYLRQLGWAVLFLLFVGVVWNTEYRTENAKLGFIDNGISPSVEMTEEQGKMKEKQNEKVDYSEPIESIQSSIAKKISPSVEMTEEQGEMTEHLSPLVEMTDYFAELGIMPIDKTATHPRSDSPTLQLEARTLQGAMLVGASSLPPLLQRELNLSDFRWVTDKTIKPQLKKTNKGTNLPTGLKELPAQTSTKSSAKQSIQALGGIACTKWQVQHNELEEHQEWTGDLHTSSTAIGGLLFDYPLNNHFSIQTGVLHQSFHTRTETKANYRDTEIALTDRYNLFEIDFSIHNHLYKLNANGKKFELNSIEEEINLNAEQTLKYLSIPVWVNYKLNPNQRLQIGAITGINANILLQNKMELLDFTVDGLLVNGFTLDSSKGLRNLNWSYVAGLNLSYVINDKWSIEGQGFCNSSLNTINKDNLHQSKFRTFNVQTGIKYTF